MILTFVESPMPIPLGTSITTAQDNSGLPDYLIGTSYAKAVDRLDQFIGNTIIYNGWPIYKVYADWNTQTLYEYTVIRVPMTGWVKEEYRYVPISVKRYEEGNATMLYVSAMSQIANFLDMASKAPVISYSDLFYRLSNPTAQPMLCDQAVDDPDADYYQTNLWSTMVTEQTELHHRLSPELPKTVSEFLTDIGIHCFSHGNTAMTVMATLYGEDIVKMPNLYLEDRKLFDPVTLQAISTCPFIPEKWFNDMLDHAFQSFYKPIADQRVSQVKATYDSGKLVWFDKTCMLYDWLDMDAILENIYLDGMTDFSATVGMNEYGIDASIYLLNKPVESTHLALFLLNIREKIRRQGAQGIPDLGVVEVGIQKTWLDDLYVTVLMRNESVFQFFLNAAYYHLISPAIIRQHLVEAFERPSYS